MNEPEPPWIRKYHPKGGWRDYLYGPFGVVWMAIVPMGDGTYLVKVGRSRRTRTAQRRSSKALEHLRERRHREVASSSDSGVVHQ